MARMLVFALCLLGIVSSARAEDSPSEKELVEAARAISRNLRAHLDLPKKSGWDDFQLRIIDANDKEPQAVKAGWEDWGDDRPTPYIAITRTLLLDLLAKQKSPESVAFLIAHQLGRLKLGHVVPKGAEAPGGGRCVNRRLDNQADVFACELLIKVGYSLEKALLGIQQLQTKLSSSGQEYWKQRFERIMEWRNADSEQWRQMPAFLTGLLALAADDSSLAVFSFEIVTREFPNSHEAWAYLGIARLGRYMSPGGAHEIPAHLVIPAASVSLIRGLSEVFHREALAALQRAQELKPGTPLVLANLGLAWLVHPDESSHEEASRFLTQALNSLKAGKQPDTSLQIQVLVNLGAARMLAGKPDESKKLFAEAEALGKTLTSKQHANIDRILAFNQAVLLSKEGKNDAALKLFVTFLEATSRDDLWWNAGYQRYLKLCQLLERKPLERDKLRKTKKPSKFTVTLADGKKVTCGDELEDVLSRLGKATTVGRVNANLLWHRFAAQGLEVLPNDDVVLAVHLTSRTASIKLPETIGKAGAEIRVGMTRRQIEAALGETYSGFSPAIPALGPYSAYPEFRVVVVYDGEGEDAVVTSITLWANSH